MKEFSRRLGIIQSTIILTVVYICMVPFGFVLRWFLRANQTSGWQKWLLVMDTLEDVRKE